MKIIDTKYGTYITEIDEEHSLFADGNYFVYVNKAGEIVRKDYAPDAEGAFKETAKVF